MEEREAATGLSEAREAAEAIAELWNARPEAIAKGHALKRNCQLLWIEV